MHQPRSWPGQYSSHHQHQNRSSRSLLAASSTATSTSSLSEGSIGSCIGTTGSDESYSCSRCDNSSDNHRCTGGATSTPAPTPLPSATADCVAVHQQQQEATMTFAQRGGGGAEGGGGFWGIVGAAAASVTNLPPGEKKLVTLVCVVMAVITGLNVASVGHDLHRQHRGAVEALPLSTSGGAAGGGNIRAASSAAGGSSVEVKTDIHVPDEVFAGDAGGARDRQQPGQASAQQGQGGGSAHVQQLMQDQAALLESVREQVMQQNDLIKMAVERKGRHPPPSLGGGDAMAVSPEEAEGRATVMESPEMALAGDFAAAEGANFDATSEGGALAPSAEAEVPVIARDAPLDGYKDSWDVHEESDIPVLWHIPRTGGSSIKQVLRGCHRMTLATEAGVAGGHDLDEELAAVRIGGGGDDENDVPYINVDTTTREGLARAGRMGLARSGGLVDAMATPLLHDANDVVFVDPSERRGRVFAMVRDPIDRAVSTFEHVRGANPELAGISLEEYARGPHVENNWMTRYLSNQIEGELNDSHLHVAMDVARRKILVGLRHQFVESIDRFERFFGWRFAEEDDVAGEAREAGVDQDTCRSTVLATTGAGANVVPYPEGLAYELLSAQNWYDMQLYEYLKSSLWVEQQSLVQGSPDRLGQAYQEPPTDENGGDSVDSVEDPLTAQNYAPIVDIPPYVCEDRYPEGFTDEPLPNQFPLLCGATRPCYDNFATFPSEPNPKDVPAFWHVPKAGGSTIKDIVGHCMGLTQADEVGVRNGHDADTTLQVIEENGNYFVNVDTSQPEGMRKARELGLAPSGLADLVTIVNIQDADYMFDQEHKGRFFSVFRHPVERAISMFYYLSKADWEPTYRPEYANMTLLEYTSRGGPVENNFMVRFLVNQRRGAVGEEQLEFAKQVLREKFVVGLLHETKESWRRFRQYFGFKPRPGMDEAAMNECIQGYLGGGSNQNAGKKTKMDELDATSEVSAKLHSQNDMDIKLYEYALEIWDEQAQFFAER